MFEPNRSAFTSTIGAEAAGDPRRALFRDAARRLAQLALVTALVLGLAMPPSIPRWYFFHQDVWLLAVQLAALGVCARVAVRWPARPMPRIDGRAAALAIAVAAAVAYLGTWLVLHRYAMSLDEQLADFAADYYQHGHLARAIPPALAPLAQAAMPLWADRLMPAGWWLTNYLPLNAVLRAGAGLIGDRWLAGPALLAAGAAASWSVARRLWPDRPAGATVSLALLLTSAQVVILAMSPYAMTAHLAVDALWLLCFVRGGRAGHAGALVLSVLAVGLHQVQFHLVFACGFVIWLWRCDRRILAATYAAVLLAAVLGWRGLFFPVTAAWLGAHGAAPGAPAQVGGWSLSLFGRLTEYQPLNSLARFAAWQNALLLPLAAWGARAVHDADGKPTIFWAMRLSCAVGLALMLYQGQGFGYRYLNGLMPLFCLLAARGWIGWNDRHAFRLGAQTLWASAALALAVTLPMAAGMSRALVGPYAQAYRLAKSAPADVVLVDARGVAFAQDLVRVDDTLSAPLLLDLAIVPGPTLVDLCRRRRVAILDARQLRPLGLLPPMGIEEPDFAFASRRQLLAALHCGRAVPMPSRRGLR